MNYHTSVSGHQIPFELNINHQGFVFLNFDVVNYVISLLMSHVTRKFVLKAYILARLKSACSAIEPK